MMREKSWPSYGKKRVKKSNRDGRESRIASIKARHRRDGKRKETTQQEATQGDSDRGQDKCEGQTTGSQAWDNLLKGTNKPARNTVRPARTSIPNAH